MPSTPVVATSNNNCFNTTLASAVRNRLDNKHKALMPKTFNRETSSLQKHLSSQAVKTNRFAVLLTATTAVNPAPTLGSASVHLHRTSLNNTTHAAKSATKQSKSLSIF